MRFEVTVDGRARTLELDPAALDAREVEPGVWSILIDGQSYEVRLEPAGDGYSAEVDGRRYRVEVADPRRLGRTRPAPGAAGRQKISSPMPGRVVRVLVNTGDAVEAGQGVVVVEAMKMQNEIRSPKAGRVTTLRVAEGAAVAGGETLAEVE